MPKKSGPNDALLQSCAIPPHFTIENFVYRAVLRAALNPYRIYFPGFKAICFNPLDNAAGNQQRNPVFLRQRLDARSQVYRVADYRIFFTVFRSDISGDCIAAMDTYTYLELGFPLRGL